LDGRPLFPISPALALSARQERGGGKSGVFGAVLAPGFFWVERAGGKPPAAIPKEEMRRGALVILPVWSPV